MTTKKVDTPKPVRDSQSGKFIKEDKKAGRTVDKETVKKSGGGTESTGPKKK